MLFRRQRGAPLHVLEQQWGTPVLNRGHPLATNLVLSCYNCAADALKPPLNYVNGEVGVNAGPVTPVSDRKGLHRAFAATTSQPALIPLDLSAYNSLTLTFWMYWDTFANDDKYAFEYATAAAYANSANGFALDPDDTTNSQIVFQVGGTGASGKNCRPTRPSGAAWHHYLFTCNRAGTSPASDYFGLTMIDGGPITNVNASTFGGNNPSGAFGGAGCYLTFMSPGHAAGFLGAGRFRNFNIWGGRTLNFNEGYAMYLNSNRIFLNNRGPSVYSRTAGQFEPWWAFQTVYPS